jgi:D-alanine-D-alanine ligase
VYDDWRSAAQHVASLHKQGHDVIVEPWVPLYDVAVPVIGADGPWILPPMLYRPEFPGRVRSYEEKRNLVECKDDPLEPVEDARVRARLESWTRSLLAELWPFDYGRFEFRYDPGNDELSFMEVNLSCNLWSKKTISRSARTLGVSHAELVETIVAHSMARQGLIELSPTERAA